MMRIVIAPDKFKGSLPDPQRCRAEAGPLLRRAGQMIARDRLAEAVTRP